MANNNSDDLVLYETREHVAIFTLNRVKDRNAVNGAVSKRLEELLDVFEADDNLWVGIVYGGSGKVFCAGADLKGISKGEPLFTKKGGFAGLVKRNRKKPLIAAVNGAALAGGCEICLACDLIVAVENAQFGLPEVKRALVAAAGGVFRLPRKIPQNIAMQMVLTGDPISAKEAHRFGLVNVLVPENTALENALKLAEKITVNAPIAVRESRGVVAKAFDFSNDEEGFAASNAAFAVSSQTEDYIEGPKAFIEKRAPKWTGKPRANSNVSKL